jgi:hypothetical protein
MMKLDHTFSSLTEIDSHALHGVTGGIHFLTAGGGSTSAAKPKKTGKGKQILTGGLLIGSLLGPNQPGPEDINLGGPIVGPPLGRPPAGAPPFPGGGPKPIPLPGGGEIVVPE